MAEFITTAEGTTLGLGGVTGNKSQVLTLDTSNWRTGIQHLIIIPSLGVGGDSFAFDIREVNVWTTASVKHSVMSGSLYALTNNTQVVSRTAATEIVPFETADLTNAGKDGKLYCKITLTDSGTPASTDYVFDVICKTGRMG